LPGTSASMFMLFDPGASPAGAFATRLSGLEKWHGEEKIALLAFTCIRELVAHDESVAPVKMYIRARRYQINLHISVPTLMNLCLYCTVVLAHLARDECLISLPVCSSHSIPCATNVMRVADVTLVQRRRRRALSCRPRLPKTFATSTYTHASTTTNTTDQPVCNHRGF
jgi:hypothetical protein